MEAAAGGEKPHTSEALEQEGSRPASPAPRKQSAWSHVAPPTADSLGGSFRNSTSGGSRRLWTAAKGTETRRAHVL